MKNLKLWKYDIRNGFFCNKDKLLLIIPAVLICRMQKFIPEFFCSSDTNIFFNNREAKKYGSSCGIHRYNIQAVR